MGTVAVDIPRLQECPACMDGLDLLPWAAGASVVSYGTRIGLRTTDADALSEMMHALPPGWAGSPEMDVDHIYSVVSFVTKHSETAAPPETAWLLYDAWHRVVGPGPRDEILEALEDAVRMKVAEFSPTRVFVHAGVVAWDGKAIVVPGKSFSGKTTMIAELMHAGATYYSDEYAVLDADGLVHPFLADASIRSAGSYTGRPVSPADLGAVGDAPIPVGLVVSTRYREGATTTFEPLSKADGAMVLLANTVSARTAPDRALAAVRAAMTDATAFEGDRGEAADAVAAILARM